MKGLDQHRQHPMVRRLLDGPKTATVPLFPGGPPVTVRVGELIRFQYRGRDCEALIRSIHPWGWKCQPTDAARWMSCAWDGIGA